MREDELGVILSIKINHQYNKIMVTESLYSLALYIFLNENEIDDTLFIVGNNVFYKEIFNNVPNYIIYNRSKIETSRFETYCINYGIIPSRFKLLKCFINSVEHTYGHDHISVSKFFNVQNLTLIEDGLGNYLIPKKISLWRALKRWLLRNPFYVLGYNKKTKKIYLTGIKDIPEIIKNKVELINRNYFLKSLPHLLNASFCSASLHNEKFQLLITQPLSEDGILLEEEKIFMYKELVKKNIPLVIKPHPREKTDYSTFFPDAHIVENYVLAETLLSHENLVEVTTIDSSSVVNYKFGTTVKVCIYGGSYNKKINEFMSNIYDRYQ